MRALIAELEEAERREQRGEPAHLVDMITRLMRLSVLRNTELEERLADEADASIEQFRRLGEELPALVREHGGSRELAAAVERRLNEADFPFRRERSLPRITVHASPGDVTLETRLRAGSQWTPAAKSALIARGYELTDEELARAGIESATPVRR